MRLPFWLNLHGTQPTTANALNFFVSIQDCYTHLVDTKNEKGGLYGRPFLVQFLQKGDVSR